MANDTLSRHMCFSFELNLWRTKSSLNAEVTKYHAQKNNFSLIHTLHPKMFSFTTRHLFLFWMWSMFQRKFCPTLIAPISLDRSLSVDYVTRGGRKRDRGLRANCENWEDSTRITQHIPQPRPGWTGLGGWSNVRDFRTINFYFLTQVTPGIRTKFSHKLDTNLPEAIIQLIRQRWDC